MSWNDFADHEYGPASDDELRLIRRVMPLLCDAAEQSRKRLLEAASRDPDTKAEAERLCVMLGDLQKAHQNAGQVFWAAQRTQDAAFAALVADCRNAMMAALDGCRSCREREAGKYSDFTIDDDWVRYTFGELWLPPPATFERGHLPDGVTGLGDIEEDAPEFGTLVTGLLDRGAFSILYGAPNAGKSWVALDLGLRVAAGMPWRGRATALGNVLYVCSEGAPGLKKRARAWREHHGIADAPFAIFDGTFDLTTDKGSDRLIDLAHGWHAKSLAGVDLIVIDTLARNIGQEDENSGSAMGRLVANIDRIRRQTGAHVALLHHEGKAQGRGPRGHNSLAGAADTIIRVEPGVATVEKQRDGERGQSFPFRIDATNGGGAVLAHIEDAAAAAPAVVDALPILVTCVRDAAAADRPYRANRAGSLYERRAELPEPLRSMGRDPLRRLIKSATAAQMISVAAGSLVAPAVH